MFAFANLPLQGFVAPGGEVQFIANATISKDGPAGKNNALKNVNYHFTNVTPGAFAVPYYTQDPVDPVAPNQTFSVYGSIEFLAKGDQFTEIFFPQGAGAVPAPSAALAGLALSGGVLMRRRRA